MHKKNDPAQVQENKVMQQKQGVAQRKKNNNYRTKEGQKPPISRQTGALHQAKQRPVQRATGNAKSVDIAEKMGEQYNVNTSKMTFEHGSSDPEKVGAEATLQDHKAKFAPGQDTVANIKHEIGHFIINTQRGTPPKPDKVINGQPVNTTDEAAADKIMNTPLQRKANTSTDTMQTAPDNGNAPLQLARSKPAKKRGAAATAKKARKVTKGSFKRPFITKIKREIMEQNPQLIQFKKVHSSYIKRSKNVTRVKPNKKGDETNFLRHLSTVINAGNEGFQEVQAAVNVAGKIVYLSANSGVSDLPKAWAQIDTQANGDDNARLARHKEQLAAELPKYAGYTLQVVDGKSGQHAETKIVKHTRDFDFIAGQRRPCTACEIFFKLYDIDPAKYNSHHGAYWESNNALESILNMAYEELKDTANEDNIEEAIETWLETNKDKLKVKDEAFINEGISKGNENDYDSASDDEKM